MSELLGRRPYASNESTTVGGTDETKVSSMLRGIGSVATCAKCGLFCELEYVAFCKSRGRASNSSVAMY